MLNPSLDVRRVRRYLPWPCIEPCFLPAPPVTRSCPEYNPKNLTCSLAQHFRELPREHIPTMCSILSSSSVCGWEFLCVFWRVGSQLFESPNIKAAPLSKIQPPTFHPLDSSTSTTVARTFKSSASGSCVLQPKRLVFCCAEKGLASAKSRVAERKAKKPATRTMI